MNIDTVDFFYVSMPEVTLEADGSQDALLVRVRAGDHEGWGECEASPLTSIAAFVTPRSHGVCQPVAASVIGERLDGPVDIRRIAALVERNSMDLLQAAHTWSGIEIALWDLLGRARDEPVWRMLGYDSSRGKVPYASLLFGADPDATRVRARDQVARGFRAVKFGWGSFGTGDPRIDGDHLVAAREGLGDDGILLVDAGQIWGDDAERASRRLAALQQARATWLEEPFVPHAFAAYAELAGQSGTVGIAGGEGAHTVHMATNLIDYGHVRFIQIDAARIGGIGPAWDVAQHAVAKGVTFVNHTFTSHLALSASLQPFAGLADHRIAEFPVEPKAVALAISTDHLRPDRNGEIHAPDAPGLGVDVDLVGLTPYLREVEILIDGEQTFRSPTVAAAAHKVKATAKA
ncbi:L-alanine-DL-glutamate epimerase-like enolase superfamily enzyme [Microbacterium sp. AK009]|uniref:mandelate racemase/muconate lactonizing enzyme family protein n=1 Tax=Microbacterium sp. AK009 TaxID=2723068 RepID=UPI0015CC3337|nr:mandelate racemase/muconate lactonizing enzyme family protein [Microbacterium sp. AK009]NYF15420.1 L-alanine-DL-glutamate epimerase-like enolase superfamily enzyme [Microbacterium sp. AK009]